LYSLDVEGLCNTIDCIASFLYAWRGNLLLIHAECYNMMYHAAHHKQEGVHEAAIVIVKAVLSRCSCTQARQFHRSMRDALVGITEQARKAVVALMAAQLVFNEL
jgi:hypothetical protein